MNSATGVAYLCVCRTGAGCLNQLWKSRSICLIYICTSASYNVQCKHTTVANKWRKWKCCWWIFPFQCQRCNQTFPCHFKGTVTWYGFFVNFILSRKKKYFLLDCPFLLGNLKYSNESFTWCADLPVFFICISMCQTSSIHVLYRNAMHDYIKIIKIHACRLVFLKIVCQLAAIHLNPFRLN